MNHAMAEKVKTGEAFDVSVCPAIGPDADALSRDTFDLSATFTPDQIDKGDRDFCHMPTERWIWSIGLLANGRILAAFDARFYQRDGVRCLWLR